ncbi:MAG: hypothetical protein KDA47_23305, partial [Planctomycetales bacterium]|nr:hypothetical protein [Planctomycetales bacterium]
MRIWRADQAQPTFGDGHAGRVLAMASAGDGQALLTASDDGTVRLWDMRTKQAVAEFPTQRQSVTTVAISSDVRYLAAGDQAGMLRVWDLQKPKEPSDVAAHDGAVLALKFEAATNSLLSSGADGRLRRWTLPLESARSFAANGLTDDLVALSRDRRFAGLLDQRGRIHVLRLADGQVVKQFNDPPRKPTALAFTGDTRKAVAGDDSGAVSVWDS